MVDEAYVLRIVNLLKMRYVIGVITFFYIYRPSQRMIMIFAI